MNRTGFSPTPVATGRAIGLLPHDLPNIVELDATLRRSAEEHGFQLFAMEFIEPGDDKAVLRLMNLAWNTRAEAAFAFNRNHLRNCDIESLVKVVDLYCLEERQRLVADRHGMKSIALDDPASS
ncbi:hypothetical protein [Nocardia sp. NPDC057668]|uniref:hypothetical protein n=1 Tax=Nocardia sp. NPDC057668 TaxID=3346202 RepID=UPI003671B21B